MKKTFICEHCGISFTLPYRKSQHRATSFCGKSCAGKAGKAVFHSKKQLERRAVDCIRQRGQYMTKSELEKALSVSSKTLSKFNVSVLSCNKLAGFKKPHRIFERNVQKHLEVHWDVETEVVFDSLLSPKGYLLRYDFRLLGTNVLVEADGSQHKDKNNPWWSEYLAECDKLKNEFAKENGFVLVRIPYTKRADYDYVMRHMVEAGKATT